MPFSRRESRPSVSSRHSALHDPRRRITGETTARRPGARATPRLLDVEDALRWTYLEEMPKARDERLALPDFPSVSPMFRLAVPSGGGPARSSGDPDPDALAIDRVVRSLTADDVMPYVELELGADDMRHPCDEAAEIREACRRLDATVIACARLGKRPPVDLPVLERILSANGRPTVLRLETDDATGETRPVPCAALRKGVYPDGAYSPLHWSPGPAMVIRERAEYAAWRAALCAIAEALSGQLQSIAVLSPSAPARPWNGEGDAGKPPRIFDSALGLRRLKEQREDAVVQRILAHRRRRAPVRRRPGGRGEIGRATA